MASLLNAANQLYKDTYAKLATVFILIFNELINLINIKI